MASKQFAVFSTQENAIQGILCSKTRNLFVKAMSIDCKHLSNKGCLAAVESYSLLCYCVMHNACHIHLVARQLNSSSISNICKEAGSAWYFQPIFLTFKLIVHHPPDAGIK